MGKRFLSREQSLELIRRGVDMSNAMFAYNPNGVVEMLKPIGKDSLWMDIRGDYYKVRSLDRDGISPDLYEGKYIPTYTLDDVLDVLPNYAIEASPSLVSDEGGMFSVSLMRGRNEHYNTINSTVSTLDAAYNLLIRCLNENER